MIILGKDKGYSIRNIIGPGCKDFPVTRDLANLASLLVTKVKQSGKTFKGKGI